MPTGVVISDKIVVTKVDIFQIPVGCSQCVGGDWVTVE